MAKNIARAEGTLLGSAGTASALSRAFLLTEREVAGRLGWSPRTLQRRRWLGMPPAFVKVGRSVRYHPTIINSFIADGWRNSTSDRGAEAR